MGGSDIAAVRCRLVAAQRQFRRLREPLMTNTTHIAALGLAALLLTTASAQAFGPRGSIGGSISDAVVNTSQADAADGLRDAVDTDEARDVDDNLHDKIVFLNNENLTDLVLGPNGEPVVGPDGKLDLRMALAAGLVKLTCRVDDDALVIANTGKIALPAKTKLRWTVAALDQTGTLKLSTDLAAGTHARTADLLDDADGESCAIKVLGH